MDLKNCKTCSNRKGAETYSNCMNCIHGSNYSPVNEGRDTQGIWRDNIMRRFMKCE